MTSCFSVCKFYALILDRKDGKTRGFLFACFYLWMGCIQAKNVSVGVNLPDHLLTWNGSLSPSLKTTFTSRYIRHRVHVTCSRLSASWLVCCTLACYSPATAQCLSLYYKKHSEKRIDATVLSLYGRHVNEHAGERSLCGGVCLFLLYFGASVKLLALISSQLTRSDQKESSGPSGEAPASGRSLLSFKAIFLLNFPLKLKSPPLVLLTAVMRMRKKE